MKFFTSPKLLLLTALLLAALLTACRGIGPEAKSGREVIPLPRELFDHNLHQGPFDRAKIDCTHCHPFKINRNDKSVLLNVDYTKLFVKPLQQLCHPCHRTQARTKSRLFTCKLCHIDTQKIVPKNHRSGWIKQHATLSYQREDCRECHDDSYCVNCHRRFETIRPRVHSRNYKFYHSLDARSNPAQCYACHRQSQCVRCHTTGAAFQ